MTVCNMLIHGCVGEVIQHDSLLPEDFKDGWFVNPALTVTGIPTIRKMDGDEYRASRNIPLSDLKDRMARFHKRNPSPTVPHV